MRFGQVLKHIIDMMLVTLDTAPSFFACYFIIHEL